jgi:tRNA threonylcarbamoyladenosine biosynthesis protein TsaB
MVFGGLVPGRQTPYTKHQAKGVSLVVNAGEALFLILETSGRAGQVALARGECVLRRRRLDEARRHARDLAPAVAELLAAEHRKPRDVQVVLVSRGPGSYTGLRVGIMAAKAFAYAIGCSLIAVDTLTAIARQADAAVTSLDVVADAQQDKVYVQRFARPGAQGELSPVAPLAIKTLAEWLATPPRPLWVSGPGLHRYAERLPHDIHVIDRERWDPQPESLLRIGLTRYERGDLDDAWTVEPLYLRPSAAEEKWDRRAGG